MRRRWMRKGEEKMDEEKRVLLRRGEENRGEDR